MTNIVDNPQNINRFLEVYKKAIPNLGSKYNASVAMPAESQSRSLSQSRSQPADIVGETELSQASAKPTSPMKWTSEDTVRENLPTAGNEKTCQEKVKSGLHRDSSSTQRQENTPDSNQAAFALNKYFGSPLLRGYRAPPSTPELLPQRPVDESFEALLSDTIGKVLAGKAQVGLGASRHAHGLGESRHAHGLGESIHAHGLGESRHAPRQRSASYYETPTHSPSSSKSRAQSRYTPFAADLSSCSNGQRNETFERQSFVVADASPDRTIKTNAKIGPKLSFTGFAPPHLRLSKSGSLSLQPKEETDLKPSSVTSVHPHLLVSQMGNAPSQSEETRGSITASAESIPPHLRLFQTEKVSPQLRDEAASTPLSARSVPPHVRASNKESAYQQVNETQVEMPSGPVVAAEVSKRIFQDRVRAFADGKHGNARSTVQSHQPISHHESTVFEEREPETKTSENSVAKTGVSDAWKKVMQNCNDQFIKDRYEPGTVQEREASQRLQENAPPTNSLLAKSIDTTAASSQSELPKPVAPQLSISSAVKMAEDAIARVNAMGIHHTGPNATKGENIVKSSVTKTSVATVDGRENNQKFQGGWSKPEQRQKAAARQRKVILSHLPEKFTAKFVASMIYGGKIEQIRLLEKTAEVVFYDAEECQKYCDSTANGLVYGKHGEKELFIFVEPHIDPQPVPGVISDLVKNMGATRCLQAVGDTSEVWIPDLWERTKANKCDIESIVAGKNEADNNCIDFRFYSIQQAARFYGILKRLVQDDPDWESFTIRFVPDPCESATGVHLDN